MHRQIKNFYDLAYEYHISAVTLWTQIVDAPYLYNPISYLLRHTIELQLKGLVIAELRKDNKHLIISDIKIDSKRFLNKTHSLLALWEYYQSLLTQHSISLDKKVRLFVDTNIKKVDRKDFSSTRYRYPFDRNDKSIDILPVDICMDGKSPDLELGIPYIIQYSGNARAISKGQRLLQDTSKLFDVVEYLFQIMENNI